MGLSSKFGKYPKCPTAGHHINGKPSIDLTKFPLPSPGKPLVVLGNNSLHPPTEVLSLLLSSHQRRFWISRSEIGFESVFCSGNKRRLKLQTIKMPIKGRSLSTKIKPKVWYAEYDKLLVRQINFYASNLLCFSLSFFWWFVDRSQISIVVSDWYIILWLRGSFLHPSFGARGRWLWRVWTCVVNDLWSW